MPLQKRRLTNCIEEAKREVAGKKREAVLEAKEEVHQLRSEAERENRESAQRGATPRTAHTTEGRID